MNTDDLLQKYKPLLLKHWLPLSLGFLGLIFFAYGLIGLFSGKAGQNDITFESFSNEKISENTFSQIVVDVEGEVIKPGIYKISSDSRLQDALVASGGLSENADREWVSKNLNLALKIKDGMKIYIPDKSQNSNVKTQNYNGEISNQSNLININSATEGELDTLPGIGMVTAQKIVSGRPYNSIEELLEKKVVSGSVFEKIKDRITIF